MKPSCDPRCQYPSCDCTPERLRAVGVIKFPVVRKECTYEVAASHDLAGLTAHPEAAGGLHSHVWRVTLIFEHEMNPAMGYQRDEAEVDASFGKRLLELRGKNLTELMSLPATSENFAMWLMFFWMVRLDEHKTNYELSGIRVSKTVDGGTGTHACELKCSAANRRGWEAFGGEVR